MRRVVRALCIAAGAAVLAGTAGDLLGAEESPQQVLAAAKQSFDQKDYARARRLAERVVEGYPASPIVVDAWLVMADSMIGAEDLSGAFEQCEKLLAAHPQTKHRSAILRREFEIGDALTVARGRVLFIPVTRLQDGVRVLERVIEHAPFGTLADDAVFAIGEGYFRNGDYEGAREQYDRLLKQYPNSELVIRARVRRAACNEKLVEGAQYDLRPVEDAKSDMDTLVRMSGNEQLAAQSRELRDVLARSDYESGLFYFRRTNIEAGVRYMRSVIKRYPDSEYADRAQRILALISAAESEEIP